MVRNRRFSVEDSRRVGDRQLPRASRAANDEVVIKGLLLRACFFPHSFAQASSVGWYLIVKGRDRPNTSS